MNALWFAAARAQSCMSWGRMGLLFVGCWLRSGTQLRSRILAIACASTRHASPSFSSKQHVLQFSTAEVGIGHGRLSSRRAAGHSLTCNGGAGGFGQRRALTTPAVPEGSKMPGVPQGNNWACHRIVDVGSSCLERAVPLGQMFKTGCQRFQTGQFLVSQMFKTGRH